MKEKLDEEDENREGEGDVEKDDDFVYEAVVLPR